MSKCVSRLLAAAFVLLLPTLASAQSSAIAGEVKDTSGAVLAGVTVEVTSPALIERVRTAVTDDAGRYSIVQLVSGVYTVTFTLPGFSTVRRDNIELTADFTAPVNAELKVGAIEETITVAAESPIVDVQGITSRTVMTRDILDAIPTGRNIQAVGIMIPGTTLAVGGGGALSRDVGGSGNLQQSPLQYRGSADTVQTVEGIRLNNLCAQGAYSGVYWNDGSFQEISYVTGADSAEMGQGGIRVNMVPKDGGNTFRGSVVGEHDASDNWVAGNLARQPRRRPHLQPEQQAHERRRGPEDLGRQPVSRRPDRPRQALVHRHIPPLGQREDRCGQLLRCRSLASPLRPRHPRPGVDDGHIVSRVGTHLPGRSARRTRSRSITTTRTSTAITGASRATIPPEASAIQVTPTSFVNVSRWTRTHTNRLLFDVGFGIYDQNYTELYQPSVLDGFSDKVCEVGRDARLERLQPSSTAHRASAASAWNNPADHFSLLRTYSASMSYVTGSHSFKVGTAVSEGDWRMLRSSRATSPRSPTPTAPAVGHPAPADG